MTREEALERLGRHLTNRNMVNHSLAVEAVMAALAGRLGGDPLLWGIVGLLHDIDYEWTKGDPARHALEGADLLQEWGFPGEVVGAVRAHNAYHGLPRESLLDKALYAADPLTGFVVACALVHPEKKLAPLDAAFLRKRFGEKAFARGANREQIASCSELGLSLPEFLSLGLGAMQAVSADLGL